MEVISGEAADAKGIGNGKPQQMVAYLASEVRLGDVVFANYPVEVFESAESAVFDGLIGADVFREFLVKIDFLHEMMSLETRASGAEEGEGPFDAGDVLPPGFVFALRFGDSLVIPTAINKVGGFLFLIDSGSSLSLLDSETTRTAAYNGRSAPGWVSGTQGRTNDASLAERVTLEFAGLRQDNSSMIAINLDKVSNGGVQLGGFIGMPILKQLILTIDYREGFIRFEHQ